jgi:hypothetical protein
MPRRLPVEANTRKVRQEAHPKMIQTAFKNKSRYTFLVDLAHLPRMSFAVTKLHEERPKDF